MNKAKASQLWGQLTARVTAYQRSLNTLAELISLQEDALALPSMGTARVRELAAKMEARMEETPIVVADSLKSFEEFVRANREKTQLDLETSINSKKGRDTKTLPTGEEGLIEIVIPPAPSLREIAFIAATLFILLYASLWVAFWQ